jgi:hypothetical protein
MLIKIRNWYGRYERPISSLSLVGGFIFGAVTLKRVDLFWENIWVVGSEPGSKKDYSRKVRGRDFRRD